MCNACGFFCCGYDGFSGCGCDHCPNPACWPEEDEDFEDDDGFICEPVNVGDEGCVNKRHLSWKTPRGNQLDRHENGAGWVRWKLTPEQVAEIRPLKGLELTTVTAKRYGVTETTIRHIQSGKTWKTGRKVAGGFRVAPWTRERRAAKAKKSQPSAL